MYNEQLRRASSKAGDKVDDVQYGAVGQDVYQIDRRERRPADVQYGEVGQDVYQIDKWERRPNLRLDQHAVNHEKMKVAEIKKWTSGTSKRAQ